MSVPFPPKHGKPFVLGAAALILSLAQVHAGNLNNYIHLGEAASSASHQYALFTLGTKSTDSSSVSGVATITGDVGMAGFANLSIGAGSSPSGNVYYTTGGTVTGRGAVPARDFTSASITSNLSQGVNDAKNASANAVSLATSLGTAAGGPSSISLGSGQSLTLNASSGNSDRYILNLSTFSMTGATLTLNGNNDPNAFFVFNIASTGSFSFTNGSQISLAGGMTAANILFNYLGTSAVTLGGGAASLFNGIVLAAGSSNFGTSLVNVGGVTVNGEIIADKVSISGGASLKEVIVSP